MGESASSFVVVEDRQETLISRPWQPLAKTRTKKPFTFKIIVLDSPWPSYLSAWRLLKYHYGQWCCFQNTSIFQGSYRKWKFPDRLFWRFNSHFFRSVSRPKSTKCLTWGCIPVSKLVIFIVYPSYFVYIHIHIYTYIHTYIHYIHTYYTYIQREREMSDIYIYTYIYTYIYILM